MKRYIFLIGGVVLFSLVFGFILYNNQKDTNNSPNEEDTYASRISTDVNVEQSKNRVSNILQNQNEIMENKTKETELSTYTTTIKDKSAGRLTNISITCSVLTNTIIRNGETFSFNQTVGNPTTERGYQEASVIIDHKTETGIGGGNCQVSSTLYNAVLNIPSLVVTERHEHGKDVTYVPEGKDAAVSYGSLDLKFRNNTGHNIRIEAATNNETITIKLVQL